MAWLCISTEMEIFMMALNYWLECFGKQWCHQWWELDKQRL